MLGVNATLTLCPVYAQTYHYTTQPAALAGEPS